MLERHDRFETNRGNPITRIAVFVGSLAAFVACAPAPTWHADVSREPSMEQKPAAALPSHPFPRWVAQIEAGKSDVARVRELFGDPIAATGRATGERIYRFEVMEIHWPADDPQRPIVAADGSLHTRPQSLLEHLGNGWRTGWSWMESAVIYPSRQPRRSKARTLPATRHKLEVVFAPDGRVRRHAYQVEPSLAKITPRG